MNEKITFQQLAESLSALTGGSQNTTETFIKELFDIVSEALSNGETVRIKGIGKFAATGISDQPVLFMPDDDLADAINTPFACFEAVVLDDDISDELLIDSQSEELEPQKSQESTDAASAINDTTDSDTQDANDKIPEEEDNSDDYTEDQQEILPEPELNEAQHIDEPEEEVTDYHDKDTECDTEQTATEESTEYDEEDDIYSEPDDGCGSKRRNTFLYILLVFIGCIAGYIIGSHYPYQTYIHTTQPMTTDTTSVSETDSVLQLPQNDTIKTDSAEIDSLPPTPQEKIIIDTIGTTRFLTTMSREYYGEMIFWVYIYEENKEKLGNPNRIRPGTTIVIPPAEKYSINKQDSASVELAKLKAMEIYAPYQK